MKKGRPLWPPFSVSGREASNLRPQRPERCALAGLRYAPPQPVLYQVSTVPANSRADERGTTSPQPAITPLATATGC